MTWRARIAEAFWRWIAHLEAALLALRENVRSTPQLRLFEGQDGAFTLDQTDGNGNPDSDGAPLRIIDGRVDAPTSDDLAAKFRRAKVELVLQPTRFMFRPLELPGRASDFLEGIIRAQIDRLTPWTAAEAAFGWRRLGQGESDRIVVTIAATARSLIAPFVNAFSELGVDSIIVCAPMPGAEPSQPLIKVLERKVEGARQAQRLRRALVTSLAAGGGLAAVALLAVFGVGGDLEDRTDQLNQRIAARRAELRSAHDATGEAAAALQRRKRETASSVIVVDALSQILPDHTYLTELRVLSDKIQIIGLTQDAPSLIRLLEQSAHFSKAVFFAPTTRSANESAEHFSIEAKVQPVYTAGR
ncbi:PilN domain-containing protein [Methylocapsa acidiphila]|uniref:PilN domain-containing protein n=1 Tax=Methylocapsa acidiphila TaxID=133552 RepID=UPI0004118DA9|nr:PilN domain-containing protein [Methylocapsa acidiphila]